MQMPVGPKGEGGHNALLRQHLDVENKGQEPSSKGKRHSTAMGLQLFS